MAKQLNDAKVNDFIGIQDNVDPLSDRKSVVRCTNLEPHVEPGLFTLREPYQLRYLKPTDPIYDRNNSEEFISFDNFYEKTARDQAEVTVLVSKAEIQAPLINGSRITSYTFRSANIYIRPHWTGSYWKDEWMWLNEPIITKVTVDPDATYKNKIQVQGYFGNMLQWTLIDVTKDRSVPYAIIRSAENGDNTDLWLSVYDPLIEVGDEIVLMRNYIPIKYLIQNYNVLREEISFHRILSKMRIGFGAKEGRVGLGIEYAQRVIQMKDFAFTNTDPELVDKEYYFADCNRMIVQPYILFNENLDFDIDVLTDTGSFIAGTYYFRMSGTLNNTDQVMVVEKSITITDPSKFTVTARVKAGSLSRRLTSVKLFFSNNGLDYYFIREISFAETVAEITAPTWTLDDNGYFSIDLVTTNTDLFVEDMCTSSLDSNNLGSWYAIILRTGSTANLSVVAATNFALQIDPLNTSICNIGYQTSNFSPLLKAGVTYDCVIRAQANVDYRCGVRLRYQPTDDEYIISYLADINIGTSYADISFQITIPFDFIQRSEDGLSFIYLDLAQQSSGYPDPADSIQIESFSIIETSQPEIDDDTILGAEMSAALGYQPTFNLVKDWQNAVYLNGITYVSPAFIEKRYETFVFGSQVSGDGANMHDVIPAGASVFPVDEYRGEVVTGMVVMHNLNIAVFTDGGLIILDPDTGNTREVARGYGLKIKGSVVVFRGSIIYASDDDFIQIAAATGYEAVPISTRSVRKIYNNVPNKLLLSACFDKYGTYHVALGEEAEFRELLLTDRGWIDQDRQHFPQVFRNGLGGRVWFLNEGDIYALPYNEDEFVGYADVYGDYRSGW